MGLQASFPQSCCFIGSVEFYCLWYDISQLFIFDELLITRMNFVSYVFFRGMLVFFEFYSAISEKSGSQIFLINGSLL